MSLKSIRESYSKFLAVLTNSGVKLTEAQKADLDSFILAIESKMTKQKEAAIKATKKIVTEHLEAEYKKVFDSILKHQAENAEIASKIQNKVTSLKESKKIARKVNNYLDLYVESVLPKQKVLDYDRMQKLENLHESLKDLLTVNEESVELKKKSLEESFDKDRKILETKIAKLQVQLNESMAKTQKLNRKIDEFKAMELLESKTKDLPSYEARQVKKRLANATTVEIEKKFDRILESIKDTAKIEEKETEIALEDEVKDIIEAEDNVKENDILTTRPSNKKHVLHIEEKETCDKCGKSPCECNEDDKFETMESVKFDENGDVKLDESDIIDSNLMKLWCSQAERINTDIVRS